MPGEQAGPQGALSLGRVDGQRTCCLALRPLISMDYPSSAEMKRVNACLALRRNGLNRRLSESVRDAACRKSNSAVLDTLPYIKIAPALYAEMEFVEIPLRHRNPIAGVHYLTADFLDQNSNLAR